MNIDVIKQWFDYVCNKYQKGYVSGDEFNVMFNQCQTSYYDFLLGHVEQYQYGRPVPRVGVGITESVSTKLSPFITTAAPTVASQLATKPGGFGRLIAMRDSNGVQIDRVEHDRLAYRLQSTVIPQASNYFYVEYATNWKIYPTGITPINIDYYPSKPTDARWGYVTTSGREVYSALSGTNGVSIDPLWHDTEIAAILARMFKAQGVVLDDAQIMNYGQSVITAGD
jgi:hypothetical protein